MKISKTRLKEIIKEELSGLGEGERADRMWASNPSNPEFEGDESDQDAEVRLQRVATSLGAGEDFVAMVREAITNAVSSEGMGWDHALSTMVDALEMLSPLQEGPSAPPSSPNPTSRRSRDADNREKNRQREADPRRAGAETAYKKHMAKAAEEREAKDKKK